MAGTAIVLLINGTLPRGSAPPGHGSLADAAAISLAEIALGNALPA